MTDVREGVRKFGVPPTGRAFPEETVCAELLTDCCEGVRKFGDPPTGCAIPEAEDTVLELLTEAGPSGELLTLTAGERWSGVPPTG